MKLRLTREPQRQAAKRADRRAFFHIHISFGEFNQQSSAHHLALHSAFQQCYGKGVGIFVHCFERFFAEPYYLSLLRCWFMFPYCHLPAVPGPAFALFGLQAETRKGQLQSGIAPLLNMMNGRRT